nr:WcaI family glycosyltransferase [Oceanococcus sp. HetDA_MAG_MS8]
MRIEILSLNYAPEPTGIGKFTADMARWFVQRGLQVTVVCGFPHYPAWRLDPAYEGRVSPWRVLCETVDGVPVERIPHYIPREHNLGAKGRIALETSFNLRGVMYWLRRLFIRAKPDAMVVVVPPLQAMIWPWLYCALRNVPRVAHVQDLQADAALQLGMLSGRRLRRLLFFLEEKLLQRAALVSTVSPAMLNKIVAKGVSQQQCLLVPNWADLQEISSQEDGTKVRSRLGVRSDQVLVLYAGNMGFKQGLGGLLEAAQALQNDARITFVMIGEGAARASLEAQASDLGVTNVKFFPLQPREQLPSILAAADIHVVLQQRAAADLVMPSKLANIFAAARPSIVTAEAGTALAETISKSGGGVCVPPEDQQALVRAIQDLAASASLRLRLGSRARAYAEENLNIDRILGDFLMSLKSLQTP